MKKKDEFLGIQGPPGKNDGGGLDQQVICRNITVFFPTGVLPCGKQELERDPKLGGHHIAGEIECHSREGLRV